MASNDIDELKIAIKDVGADEAKNGINSIVAALEKLEATANKIKNINIGNGGASKGAKEAANATGAWDTQLKQTKTTLEQLDGKLKVLAAQMNVVNATYGKTSTSEEAVAERTKNLQAQIDLQVQKISELQNALSLAQQAFGANSKQVFAYEAQIENANAALIKLQNNMAGLGQNPSLDGTKNESVQRGMDDDASSSRAEQLEQTKVSLQSLDGQLKVLDAQIKAVGAAFDQNGTSADSMRGKTEALSQQIQLQTQKIYELQNALQVAGQAYGANSSQALGYQAQLINAQTTLNQMKASMDSAQKTSSKLWSSIKSGATKAASSLKSVAVAPFKRMGESIKTATSKVGQLFAAFKRIAMYRLLRSAIKAITEAFKEGTKNAYEYSKALGGQFAKSMDSLATEALYLKNSLGAMVIPLVNAITPAINFVIDKFVDLLNVVNQVIARLSGASTWTRALKYPKQYGEEATSAGKAMKELKATILGIDEINPLQDNSDRGGSGGGSGMDASQMFEEVALDGENAFGGIFDTFKKAWDKNGASVIESIRNAFGEFKELIGQFGSDFAFVWNETGRGSAILDNVLQTVKNIFDFAGKLAKKFRDAWKENGRGQTMLYRILGLWEKVTGAIEKVTQSTAEWVDTLDFGPLLDGFNEVIGGISDVFGTILDFGQRVWDEVLEPISGWFINSGLPAALEAVGSALDAIDSILSPLLDAIMTLWQALQPVVEWVEGVVVEIFGELQKAFEEVAAVFEECGPDIQNIFTIIGEAVQWVWGVIEPIFNLIKEIVFSVFQFIVQYLGDKIRFLIELFSGLLTFLKGVFTGDFKMAWEGIKKIGESVVNWFKNRIEHTKQFFERAWTGIKDFAINIWNMAKEKIGHIWSVIKDNITKAVNYIRDMVKNGFEKAKQIAIDVFNKLKEKIVGIWDGIKSGIAKPINAILSGIEKFVNAVIRGINWMIRSLNALSFDVPEWVPVLGGKKFGFNIRTISEVSIPRLAEGGIVNAGTAFIAGEQGAEVVANLGNRTGVMNTDEMRESVELGVLAANAEQNSLLQQGIALLREIVALTKDGANNGGVTGADLLSAFGRMNRRAGKTLVAVG